MNLKNDCILNKKEMGDDILMELVTIPYIVSIIESGDYNFSKLPDCYVYFVTHYS